MRYLLQVRKKSISVFIFQLVSMLLFVNSLPGKKISFIDRRAAALLAYLTGKYSSPSGYKSHAYCIGNHSQ